jgi:hypothetical protein
MAKDLLHDLFEQYKHRDKRTDSDCTIVEQVWRFYWANQDKETGSDALSWLLGRLKDPKTNDLARAIIHQHIYLNRHVLSSGHRKQFRDSLRAMQKKKKKMFKHIRH